VVDGQPHAGDAELGEELRVLVGEEAVEQAVEEPGRPVGPQHAGDGLAHRRLAARIAGDEVLHVHPAAEPHTTQVHACAVGVDYRITLDSQHRLSFETFEKCALVAAPYRSVKHSSIGRTERTEIVERLAKFW